MKEIHISFVKGIESYYLANELIIDSIKDKYSDYIQDFENNLEEFGQKEIKEENGEEKTTYKIPVIHHNKILRIQRKLVLLSHVSNSIPRSLIVSLVSLLDNVISDTLKEIFTKKTDILKSSNKSISIEDIFSFSDINDLKNHFIEKEIESILRENHLKQLELLESKLSINLRSDSILIEKYIELTERRNLFVHTNGIVNDQYILNMKKVNTNQNKEPVKKGDELICNQEYILKSIDLVLEFGIKFIQTIWRKHFPNDTEEADKKLNSLCYDLIFDEKYNLALIFLNFATSKEIKIKDGEVEHFLILNKAQTLKWMGKDDECQKLLNSRSWSGLNNQILVAKYSLDGQLEEALKLMVKLADSKEMDKLHFKEWPIFKELRKHPNFSKLYKEKFNEEFEELDKSSLSKQKN